MRQVLQHVRSGRTELAEVPEPGHRSGGVVVRNAVSLISAGTERMVIDFAGKSMLGKARERPDLVRQVLDKVKKDGVVPTVQTVMSRLDQPIPLGYSCAGVVEEVGRGAEEYAVGDRIACAGMGYASHASSVFVPKNLTVKIPDNVSFEDASYVTLGAIALQGVRVADVKLGENVAVIGLGLLGQLTVQILKASGCRVIGIDLEPAKIALARQLGADVAVSRSDDVELAIAEFTSGIGVDTVIVAAATDSNDPIELAGAICRDRGAVVMVGAVKMDIPRKVYYEKELQLRLSRSYGPGRYDPEYEEGGRDYPISYVRWTERRNMEEFLRLVSTGQITPAKLTTHRFAIDEAVTAYAIVTGKERQPFMGVLLTYPHLPEGQRVRTLRLRNNPVEAGRVGIGFVGAGNFAKSVLLPRFRSSDAAALVGLSTSTGMSATTTGEKFGFAFCTTDTSQLLGDENIDAVVIATRHGSHAHFAASALRSGKAVFVEKPLAIDEEGLQMVVDAQRESGQILTVGFNRRFSPFAAEIREAFRSAGPLAITYRVNAGYIPPEVWVHDPDDGGGRIIGEACHFIDFIQSVVDADLVEVYALGLGGRTAELHDTVTMVLRYADGSVGNINYFSNGDKSFAKERVEVYGGGGLAVLDDFRELTISRNGKRTRTKKLTQDKGFDREIAAFLHAVRSGGHPPIPLHSLVQTSRATFAIEESLRTGSPVSIPSALR
jgi:predicted dehydrogenase/threonine dehydrogenase-like Zn-dependent dehydrogenase